MTDIARLGIAVDSSQADRGTLSLTRLAGAGRLAETAIDGLSSSTRGASAAAAGTATNANGAASALDREAAAAREAANALGRYNAANQNIAGARRANVGNIAAQFQDIAVTAQGGMSAMTIALQQGTQLAAVMGSMESPLKGLAAAFASVLSPVSLLTIGLVGLAAAGLQSVNWAELAGSAMNFLADNLETIAPYAVAAAAGLALIYAPALLGGLVTLIGLIGSATKALVLFALANPAVAFLAGMIAIVAAANTFRDELTQIFGFDIVGAAKDGVNNIIGGFVGAFAAIKVAWDKLPAVMSDIGTRAGNLLISAMESAINFVINALKNFYRTINPLAALADAAGGGTVFSDILGTGMLPGKVELGRIDNPNAGATGAALGEVQAAMAAGMGTDYVGAMGEGIAAGASMASEKLKELAGWITTVDEKAGKKKKGEKTEQQKYEDIVAGANRTIASLLAEQDALGLTEEAAAALRYETELLNQAQQQNVAVTPQMAAHFKLLAGAMAEIEIATKKAREVLDFVKDTTRGFITDLRNGLQEGKGFWESFGNAAVNALNKIADKLLNDVLDAVFQVNGAIGGGSGGGGLWGFLGGLFGFGGGGGGSWAAINAGFASGTPSATPGARWVGENGPEIMTFNGGEKVFSNKRSMAMAANQNEPVVIEIGISVDDDGSIRAIAQQEGSAAADVRIRQYDKGSLKRHIANNERAKKRVRKYG